MAPFLHPGEMTKPTYHNDASISAKTLNREFVNLFSINLASFGLIEFYMDRDNIRLVGIDAADSNFRVSLLYSLYFKETCTNIPEFIKQKCIQVNNVYLNKEIRSKQIASQVYFQLAKKGYSIISDTVQFETAQGLWKKLASESNKHGCVVYAADTDYGIFKDSDGKPIAYNGTNIKDHEIWTTGSDFNGNYRVLILTSLN